MFLKIVSVLVSPNKPKTGTHPEKTGPSVFSGCVPPSVPKCGRGFATTKVDRRAPETMLVVLAVVVVSVLLLLLLLVLVCGVLVVVIAGVLVLVFVSACLSFCEAPRFWSARPLDFFAVAVSSRAASLHHYFSFGCRGNGLSPSPPMSSIRGVDRHHQLCVVCHGNGSSPASPMPSIRAADRKALSPQEP